MITAPARILIVEDEADIAQLVELHLGDAGFRVDVARSCAHALALLRQQRYALAVLDLMLPDGDGLDVCRWLRTRADTTPILILTARTSETDRVVGLEVGADDYLIKPFGVRELVARVRAILRRTELSNNRDGNERRLEIDGLVIEPPKRRAIRDGADAGLTRKEFDLLLLLASNPGRVFTRGQLLDRVWGGVHAQEHAVNTHVNRLRSKIERDPSRPHYVRTVWGVDYRFADPRHEDH